MTDNLDARFAAAGENLHNTIGRLLQAYKDRAAAHDALKAEHEALKAASADAQSDKERLCEYLESVAALVDQELAPAPVEETAPAPETAA